VTAISAATAAPWIPTTLNTDTITVSSHAGTIAVTKGTGSATDSAACTLTMSSDTATAGTVISRKLINSDTSAHAFTIHSAAAATIDTVTVPASSFSWRSWQSSGTAWTATSGALDTADLPANATPATTDIIDTEAPATGLHSKSTVAQVVSQGFPAAIPNGTTATTQTANSADTKVATDAYVDTASGIGYVGTFATPDTTAGALTLTHKTTVVYISAAAATRTYTLPAAASFGGYSVQFVVVAGTNHVNLQPASGAQLNLAGTLLTANHYAQAATSAAKNTILAVSDAANWNCGYEVAAVGTWADAASP
jgi:hypothetical protein